MNKYERNQPPQMAHRVNQHIRISPVRVVRRGEQLGVMPTNEAMRIAGEEGLDLVEIAPRERPPVCHILDYGRYRYEQSVREKDSRRKQKSATDKEIRLSPVVDDHDLETKIEHARQFIAEGRKVQFLLRFKRRQIVHQDIGYRVIERVLVALQDVAMPEASPKLDGKSITCRVIPKKNDSKHS